MNFSILQQKNINLELLAIQVELIKNVKL